MFRKARASARFSVTLSYTGLIVGRIATDPCTFTFSVLSDTSHHPPTTLPHHDTSGTCKRRSHNCNRLDLSSTGTVVHQVVNAAILSARSIPAVRYIRRPFQLHSPAELPLHPGTLCLNPCASGPMEASEYIEADPCTSRRPGCRWYCGQAPPTW